MEPLQKKSNVTIKSSIAVNIINDYYDIHDISLENIKQLLNLSKKSINKILGLEKTFEAQLEEKLLNNVYPYLKNAFYSFYLQAAHFNNQLYLLLIILSKKEELELLLIKNYKFLINSNHFSIQNKYSSFFVKEVIDSIEYKEFVNKMAKWHSQNEMVFFYLWILNEYFNVTLSFNKDKLLIEENFQLTFRTYTTKMVLKLLSKISKACSFISKVDDPFMAGFYLIISGTMFKNIPTLTELSSTLTKGLFGFTAYSIGMKKLSEYLNHKGQIIEFCQLSGMIRYIILK